ncbi:MAG: metal ABC transporter ATP-binding protein [Planctomycetota bacterium]
MNGMEPIVELRGVTFAYSAHHAREPALDNVTLEVWPSDFLAIIGPNGGGKTTLLKLILGLLRPRNGTVKVLGDSPTRVRHRIGYVPQQTTIDLSVPANVLDVVLTGRLHRSSWGPWFRRRHVEAALESLRVTETADLARRRFGTLSGGQRQRVLIARALAADAELLLLDEPTTGIDVHMERSMTDLLHRLNEQVPLVIVSHDVSFVSRHLKRVACLNRQLTVHAADEISYDMMAGMYHENMHAVRHLDECPLSDAGCDSGCETGSRQHGGPPSDSQIQADSNDAVLP